MSASATLHGREAECRALDEYLDSVRERAVVAVLEGEAGVGKSVLCRYAERQAVPRGVRVLSVAGLEGESDMPLAGLSALVRPLVAEAARLPPGQQQAVLAAAGHSDDVAVDRFTLAAATLGLLGAAAESSPLLLVVDDCHWLDETSMEALAFAVRRLDADAVLALFTARSGQCPSALHDVRHHVDVSGLDRRALGAVLADAGLPVTEPVAEVVHAVTGGLPLAALETAGALTESERDGRHPLPDPLPVGRRVTESYRASLQALPRRTHDALGVAVAAGSASGDVLAAALDALGLAIADLEPAEEAGVLTLTPAGGIGFAHPLLRAAVFGLLTPAARRAAHRALVGATGHDPERRARHLLGAATGPSEEVASGVEDAARQWFRRGGPTAAAAMFAQAAAASPPGGRRATRHLEAARAFGLAGRPDEALRHAREVIAATVDPAERCDAQAVVMASSLWNLDSRAAAATAVDEARRAAALHPTRAALVLVLVSSALTSHGDLRTAVTVAEEAFRLAGLDGADPGARSAARDVFAMTLTLTGRHPEAQRLLGREAIVPGPELTSPVHSVQFPGAVQTLVRLERLDEAHGLVRTLVGVCGERSAPSVKAYVQACALELLWWRGRWSEAVSAGEEALALATGTGQDLLARYAGATLARAHAARGADEVCRHQVATALAGRPVCDTDPVPLYGLSALGLLELGRGDAAAALPHLRDAAAIARSCGLGDPRAVPFGPDLVEALVRVGDRRGARAAYEDHAAMAETSATAWAAATRDRCRALVLADSSAADDLFAGAVEHHGRSDCPFDAARTRLCWGEYRRRRRDLVGCRSLLQEALDVFEGLGARPWAHRAALELRAAGGRPEHRPPPELSALSPQELRCALAVADGLSNRDVAATLFLSPRTVEYHLGKVFVKLGLTSRVQLARLVASPREQEVGL